MTSKEIAELLKLKDWSQARLGRELDVHESTVSLWLSGDRHPTGPARKYMREWLDQARKEAELATSK